jgi:outer membrane immunogenic protein
MKKLLLATVALVALGATVPALAADLGTRSAPYTKAPAYMAPIYNWTGFYIGGHIGGAFGGNHGFAGTTNGGNSGSFLGGVQAGADYQFASSWVAGVEAQYSWLGSNNNNSVAFGNTGFVYNNNQRALGSFTGRVGYTWGPGLLYVKGGYAYSDFNQSLTLAGVPQAFALNGNHHDGYTVGAGLEYMFAPSWSVKGEYQYYNFGNTTFTTGPATLVGTRFRNDEHSVKIGVNYRFGWGNPATMGY